MTPHYADADKVELMSDEIQALHLDPEGFWPKDGADVPAPEWSTSCAAGFLHSSQSESVGCLCGFDAQEWPESAETSGGLEVGDLPGVEGPAPDRAGAGDAAIASERALEQVDGLRRYLAAHDSLRIDRDAGITTDTHGIGAPLDADAAVRVDDASEVSEQAAVHNSSLSSGGDVTTPFYRDEWLEVHRGDARDVLRTLKSESVDCVVTSPP
jgi:hypothetical protein